MKEIVKIERKRVLNKKFLIIIFALFFTYSIFSSIKSLSKYNVYDQAGNIIISSKDNLKESKLEKHNKLLDKKTIEDVVKRKDKSKYLYNSNLVTLIVSNYEKKIEDLSDKDMTNFYNERVINVKNNLDGSVIVDDINKLVFNAERIKTPLEIGYAEGWKNLNIDMIDFVTMMIFFIPFIIIPLFGEDPKLNMKGLYKSTKHGKKDLVKGRLIAAIEIGSMIYFTGVFIFTMCKLIAFGFDGGNLPIQSSVNYLFCPYNLTYFQQYLINVCIGYVSTMMIVSLAILITVISSQILSSAVVLSFVLVIMTMLPNNNFSFNHYFKNFLPYSMTNFNNYYIHPEIYSLFGSLVPMYVMVILVAILVCVATMICSMIVMNKKFVNKM